MPARSRTNRTVRPRRRPPPSNPSRRRHRPPAAPSRGRWLSVSRRSSWASSPWAGRCSPPAVGRRTARRAHGIRSRRSGALPDGWAVTATNFFVGNSTITLEGPAADTEHRRGRGVRHRDVLRQRRLRGARPFPRSGCLDRQRDKRISTGSAMRATRSRTAAGSRPCISAAGPGVVPGGRGRRHAGRAALRSDGVRPGDDRREGRGSALDRSSRNARPR